MAGKSISRAEAQKMVKRHKDKHQDNTHSVYFDHDCLTRLYKEGKGLRVYFARHDDDKMTVVLQAGATLEQFGQICPPVCPPPGEDVL